MNTNGDAIVPYLDESMYSSFEADLSAAHESLAHGDFKKADLKSAGIKAAEIIAPAALLTYLNARSATGELKIGPAPVDLTLGLLLLCLGAFDVLGGDWSEHLVNVGIGGVSAYAVRTSAAFGAAAGPLALLGGSPAQATAGGFGHGHDNVAGVTQPQISGAVNGPLPANTHRFVVQRAA